MDTKASKKQGGRPKKVVNYDHEYIIDFLRLFITDAQSWDDCIGKFVGINDLIERDICGKFCEIGMLNKIKPLLVVRDYSMLRPSKKVYSINTLILFLKKLAKEKSIDLYVCKRIIHGRNQRFVCFTSVSS